VPPIFLFQYFFFKLFYTAYFLVKVQKNIFVFCEKVLDKPGKRWYNRQAVREESEDTAKNLRKTF